MCAEILKYNQDVAYWLSNIYYVQMCSKQKSILKLTLRVSGLLVFNQAAPKYS